MPIVKDALVPIRHHADKLINILKQLEEHYPDAYDTISENNPELVDTIIDDLTVLKEVVDE